MATTSINLKTLKNVVYNSPSQNFNEVEPNIVQFGSAAVWAKPFTLTAPALPTGVSSFTIRRVSTQTSYAKTGIIISGNTTTQNTEIYYGDVLSISATAATGYTTPTAKLSQTTVTGDVTAIVRGGQYVGSWHTIWTGNASANATASYPTTSDTKTITINGLSTSRRTRLTGTISVHGGFTAVYGGGAYSITPTESLSSGDTWTNHELSGWSITKKCTADWTMGSKSGSVMMTCEALMSIISNGIQVTANSTYGEAGEFEFFLALGKAQTYCGITITKVEQFY